MDVNESHLLDYFRNAASTFVDCKMHVHLLVDEVSVPFLSTCVARAKVSVVKID